MLIATHPSEILNMSDILMYITAINNEHTTS